MRRTIATEKDLRRASRRELLKLLPLGALGVFLFESPQRWLLTKGLGLSDAASQIAFRRGSMAHEFSNSEVAPFEKFPYNFWNVVDPEIELDKWTLAVEGLVRSPGQYRLADLQKLPYRE